MLACSGAFSQNGLTDMSMEAEGRECEWPYIAKVLEKCRKE